MGGEPQRSSEAVDPIDWQFEPFPPSALEGSISERFETVAERYANRLAVSDQDRSFTYAELASFAGDVARAVAGATEGEPGPVGILLRNEARYAAAVLGVLAAGNGYLPLDADQPLDRSRAIARRSGARAILSAGPLAARARTFFPRDIAILDLDDLPSGRPPSRRPGPNDLAWITYTSGSTGEPKGVYQDHRRTLYDVMQSTDALHLSAEDRMTTLHTPVLFSATRVLFGGLLNGASIHCLSPLDLLPSGLAREMRRLGITIFRSVPMLFRRMAESLAPDERFDALRLVFLGGDRVGWGDLDVFRRVTLPGAALGVHLGSTECSIIVQWIVDERLRRPGRTLPVGRELADRRIGLIDDDGRPVPDGAVGEFVVAGRHLALGYWNDAALTAESFVPDPRDPEGRMFRTGDLGRRGADGYFEFVGRKDRQVKISGRRIEPGEVENVLCGLDAVRDGAVIVRRDASGAALALIAYCETEHDVTGLLPRHLMQMLARLLPRFMLPAAIMILPELPRLPNMKIDRTKLAEIDAARAIPAADPSEAPLVREVAGVFERVLQRGGATADDNVVTLGGDSLQSVMIAAELEIAFGLPIPIDVFEDIANIRELARWISERSAPAEPGWRA